MMPGYWYVTGSGEIVGATRSSEHPPMEGCSFQETTEEAIRGIDTACCYHDLVAGEHAMLTDEVRATFPDHRPAWLAKEHEPPIVPFVDCALCRAPCVEGEQFCQPCLDERAAAEPDPEIPGE